MRFGVACIIPMAFASISFAQFDESFLWKYYTPDVNNDGSGFEMKTDGLESIFLHSNMYGIRSFNWNYVSAQYEKGNIGFGADFSFVGYRSYYQRSKYRGEFIYRPYRTIIIVPSIEITSEEFGDLGRFSGTHGELYLAYFRGHYGGGIGLTDIRLKEPYNNDRTSGPAPFLFGSWIFDEGLMLSVGIRRFENNRTRWIFDQSVLVNRFVSLNFGYLNKPSNLYGGLSFSIRKFSLIISYSSTSGLNDSIIWGISYGG